MELKFFTDRYVCQVAEPADPFARYRLDLEDGGEWSMDFVRGGMSTPVDARDADGNARWWPSAAMAQLAAQQHYERMCATGETPDVAASRIPTDPAWYEAKMGGTT